MFQRLKSIATNNVDALNGYDGQATHHFFFGDESSLGLFHTYKEIALESSHEYFGVLELESQYEADLEVLKLLVDSVPPSYDNSARNAIGWMDDMHPNCWKAWKRATFYLSGGEELVQAFMDYLLARDVAPRQIRIIASAA
jgi:ATP sulfurylase